MRFGPGSRIVEEGAVCSLTYWNKKPNAIAIKNNKNGDCSKIKEPSP